MPRNKYEPRERHQVSRKAVTYGHGGEGTRTYARYDWQRHFEESIMTPFPDEWSPALTYLYEAHRLEAEGADREKVQEVLEKVRQIDSDATTFYITRWSIIKKVQSRRQRDRQKE